MTSNPHASYVWGLRGNTMGCNNQKQCRETEQIYKPPLSSDCSLELDYMKLESLVIPNQQVGVNMSLLLALTACQTMGAEAF